MMLKLVLAAIISTSGNLYDSMQDRMLYIKADKVKIIYHQGDKSWDRLNVEELSKNVKHKN